MTDTLAVPETHGMMSGDRLKISGVPNSRVTVADLIVSSIVTTIRFYQRPSKGYAKHVRWQKAKKVRT